MSMYAVILAGGHGKRFWPVSRRRKPKQFLPIAGDSPMILRTVNRVLPIIPKEHIIIVTSDEFSGLVHEIFPWLPEENIIYEPVGRNTGPAIAWAAMLLERRDPDAVMAVLASDHVIDDEAGFRKVLQEAGKLSVEAGDVVTLGIVPERPETGYGYIKIDGVFRDSSEIPVFFVECFVEKPDRVTAERFLAEGGYFWNSGMFVFSVKRILKDIQRLQPAIYEGIGEILAANDISRAAKRVFPGLPDVSIDVGIMEKASGIKMIPINFSWEDVGSWAALYKYFPDKGNGNRVAGDHITIACENVLISGSKRLIAAVGLKDIMIVDTEDALLVCRKDAAQKVNEISKILQKKPHWKRFA